MRLLSILAVLAVMATAMLGCKAEGEVDDNDMSTSVVSPR
jgi:hypothetical protein